MPGLVREMTISSIGTIASGLPIAATFFKQMASSAGH
jgi:hypothetical protein